MMVSKVIPEQTKEFPWMVVMTGLEALPAFTSVYSRPEQPF